MKDSKLSSNKRIAKNTIVLFFRTLVVMAISLYTSRIVLDVLGVNDYGIYNVVGGVVSMLVFLNSAMVQASQRYMNFAQGEGGIDEQIQVFSTSVRIHFCIALIVLFILETAGLWYVNNKVVLPPDRLYAANIIFQFSILTFLTKIFVVPFNASVIAHERMQIYAYISILDALMQLGVVYLLQIISFDKLVLYGGSMFGVALLHFSVYFLYCKINFAECRYKANSDWGLFKEMFAFASWAFIGGFGYIARGQGVNLVINLFCGPSVNAARAVASQVSSAIQNFVSSFQTALNPQITKRYAAGDSDSMMTLVRAGSKYSFLSLLICCSPLFFRGDYVLGLWLKNVPEYAAQFLIMVLAMNLVTSMGGPLNTAMQATGNIKKFQIVVSVIMCCDIPLAYLLLSFEVEPYLATGVSVFTACLCLIAKLCILHELVAYNIKDYIISVILRNALIMFLGILTLNFVNQLMPYSFIGLLLLCITTVIVYAFIVLAIGLEKWERNIVKEKVIKIIKL